MLGLSRRLAANTRLRTSLTTPRTTLTARQLTIFPSRGTASSLAERPQAIINDTSDELPIVSVNDKKVNIGWDTQNWSRFHNIWLRDHCRCPSCFHSITKQRLLNTFEIPRDIRPLAAEATSEGLQVTWPGETQHTSFYPWEWLQRTSYDPKPAESTSEEKIVWGSKIGQLPPSVTYDQVMSGDKGLYEWLKNIDRFGFSLVSGIPASPEATEELCKRIGFIRETQYGRFWDFTADLSKGDTAYTNLALGAHTDNTYFTDPSGLQLFHLLSHTEGSGGSTLLVDGFYVASILKELHPNHYETLSTTPFTAHAAGDPHALYCHTGTVLKHDAKGQLTQVRWNNDDRSVLKDIEPGKVEDWYDAIRTWNKLLSSPDSEYWVQLTPGTAVVTDNHRVLHGRSAFTGKRRMCGAYVGIDEFHSKLAVLEEKFAPDTKLTEERSVWGINF